jgi:hypothetical protein
MQSRERNCSELSCLRSEDILSVASSVIGELIYLDVCCTCVFSPSQIACIYTWKSCCNSQHLHLFCSLGHPSSCALFSDHCLKPLMGCSCLFLLIIYQLLHTLLSSCSQSEISLSKSGSSLNSRVLFVHCFEVEAFLNTCNTYNTNRHLLK